MAAAILEWFRDENGDWATPEGRRGEFVFLVALLVVFAVHAHFEVGLPAPDERPIVALFGVLCGFWYATYGRKHVVDYAPESAWTYVSTILGGFGFSLFKLVHVATPIVVFVVTAVGTVLLVYTVRVASPVHDGMEPPPRGAKPPSEVS
ncbi:hypothetical protein [Halosolutus gelatinilyticus]|uniref:hypothetical protein n=1 Tax=Halosolutus gelatinilyticus TaxID=2931975 RepID=UPI001FF39415|nr:hypothetical protein [Halosolutus gelatinilyticus]